MSTGTAQLVWTMAQATPLMQPADWIFYKGISFSTKGIRIASLSEFSHVGMVAFRDDDENQRNPLLLDTLWGKGGRAISLDKEVGRYPGQYYWFQTNPNNRWPEFNRAKAVDRMWDFTGDEYGKLALWWASFIFLPGIRILQKAETFAVDTADTDKIPPFCSMAVDIATRHGGVDPVNFLRSSLTTPGELSRSKFAECMGALVP